MGTPTRADVAAYQAKLRQKSSAQIIGDLAANGWSLTSGLAGVIGAIESTAALSSTGAASVATKFSVWTLPISAFLLGTSIRTVINESGASKDNARASARSIIIMEALRDATDKHFAKYPDSKLRDDSRPNGLILLDDPKYSNVSIQIATLFQNYWTRVDNEIHEIQDAFFTSQEERVGPMVVRENSFYRTDWKSYVHSRFAEISAQYARILEQAETLSRH